MTTDLFIKYDVATSTVLAGPCTLSGALLGMSPEELNAEQWFLVLPQEYDVGAEYDANVFVAKNITYIYTSTPYPAVRKMVTTQPRPIQDVKRYVVLRLTEFRNMLFDSGFIYGGVEFDANSEARGNWTAANAAVTSTAYLMQVTPTQLDSLPGYETWTRKDNNESYFKRTEILDCSLKLAAWAANCYRYCRQRKTDVILATTFQEVWDIWKNNSIDDWPNRNLGGQLTLPQPSTNDNLASRPAEEQAMLNDNLTF